MIIYAVINTFYILLVFLLHRILFRVNPLDRALSSWSGESFHRRGLMTHCAVVVHDSNRRGYRSPAKRIASRRARVSRQKDLRPSSHFNSTLLSRFAPLINISINILRLQLDDNRRFLSRFIRSAAQLLRSLINQLLYSTPEEEFILSQGAAMDITWSGLSPGGTHVYSSSAQPLSSSLCECLWWCCIRASCNARPAGAACTGLLNGSWWGAPPAPLGNAMAIAIGGPGPRPSSEGPLASVEARWCSSRGHLQLLHTFLQKKNANFNHAIYIQMFIQINIKSLLSFFLQ